MWEVKRNHCNCHPETCNCPEYRIVDTATGKTVNLRNAAVMKFICNEVNKDEPVSNPEPVGYISPRGMDNIKHPCTNYDLIYREPDNNFTPVYATPPDAAKRIAELERVCEGLSQDAIDGGFTVKGLQDYAKQLESELAGLRDAYCGAMNDKRMYKKCCLANEHNMRQSQICGDPDYCIKCRHEVLNDE
jgi:hypothetical protein